MKANISKAEVYNSIAEMELRTMDEIHAIDVEKDRVDYYIKLGELNTYTKLKHFIAEFPEYKEEKEE